MNRVIYYCWFLISLVISQFAFSQNQNFSASRLPGDSIHVVHYDIHLSVLDFDAKTIDGYTELQITSKINGLNTLPLELLTLTVDSAFINNIKTPFVYNDTTLLKIPLAAPLNINDTVVARIYYHGHPFTDASDWGGFHFVGSYAFNLGVGFDSNPHNLGKSWFPCVDDFTDRALYDMYITVSDINTAVCGGTLISEVDNGNGTRTFHWKMNNTLPTYLASVAVGNYVPVNDTFAGINGQTPIAIYVPPAHVQNVPGSFLHLKNILSVYENRFGAYPWERVGYVGAAKGAMEHATNITYPNSSINGSLSDEWLYAHELSHMWFGDKVTCASADDMWLNEGWAVFCESVFREGLYGKESYKTTMRSKLKDVLQFTHIKDGGYRALYGIPPEYTYGSTVYDKGGQVAHTLRGYLGDSLFFSTIKAYLNQFAYHHASSVDLRDFITNYTGINMNDFFDAWVFQPGFPQFSVDSFAVLPNGATYQVTVFVKQRLKGTSIYSNSNRVELGFINSNWQSYNDTMSFSGSTGSKTFVLPFQPSVVLMDPNDKLSDAITDYINVVKTGDSLNYTDCFSKFKVHQASDSAFIRVEHNWVAPDSLKMPVPGLRLSDYRYWKIDGIFPSDFNATGYFFYNRNANLDNTLITSSYDSLIILYRQSPAFDWQPINFRKQGVLWSIGNLIVPNLQKGEYTLAVWDQNYLGLDKSLKNEPNILKIYPNPSDGEVVIEFNVAEKSALNFINASGLLVDSIEIAPTQHIIRWNARTFPKGVYLIQLSTPNKRIMENKKIVLQ